MSHLVPIEFVLMTLLAFHGGESYEVDRNLTVDDCAALMAPGAVQYVQTAPSEWVDFDTSTRLLCRPQENYIPAPRPMPETRVDLFAPDPTPRLIQYGTNRMSNDTFRALMGLGGKKGRKSGGKRGRPRKER